MAAFLGPWNDRPTMSLAARFTLLSLAVIVALSLVTFGTLNAVAVGFQGQIV